MRGEGGGIMPKPLKPGWALLCVLWSKLFSEHLVQSSRLLFLSVSELNGIAGNMQYL